MSISKRKLEANRANAQKSPGPVTEAGKAKVSLNAVQHGLCGRFRVLPCEDQAEYDTMLEGFMQAEQPADDVERELVAKMARHTWLSERSIRFQEACFLFQPQTPEQQATGNQSVGVMKDIDVYIRYQAAHDRAYQRAANELIARRKERRLAEIGSVRQKQPEAQEKRREEKHAYQVKRAKTAVAIAEQKLEREIIHTGKVKTAAAAQQAEQIAA